MSCLIVNFENLEGKYYVYMNKLDTEIFCFNLDYSVTEKSKAYGIKHKKA